jgi:hypothetical protein
MNGQDPRLRACSAGYANDLMAARQHDTSAENRRDVAVEVLWRRRRAGSRPHLADGAKQLYLMPPGRGAEARGSTGPRALIQTGATEDEPKRGRESGLRLTKK